MPDSSACVQKIIPFYGNSVVQTKWWALHLAPTTRRTRLIKRYSQPLPHPGQSPDIAAVVRHLWILAASRKGATRLFLRRPLKWILDLRGRPIDTDDSVKRCMKRTSVQLVFRFQNIAFDNWLFAVAVRAPLIVLTSFGTRFTNYYRVVHFVKWLPPNMQRQYDCL